MVAVHAVADNIAEGDEILVLRMDARGTRLVRDETGATFDEWVIRLKDADEPESAAFSCIAL